MKKHAAYFFLTLVMLSVSSILAYAGDGQPEMADTMRSNGKIYIVVSIVLIVLAGLIVYLFTLDKKVKKLEDLFIEKTKKRA
jgi:hypothetical protein